MCWLQEQVYKIGPTNFSTRKELVTTGVKKKVKCLRAFESLNVTQCISEKWFIMLGTFHFVVIGRAALGSY